MKRSDKDIDQILKRYMPPLSLEERKKAQAARKKALGELRERLDEVKARLDAGSEKRPRKNDWPGEVEPVVLAAAFLCHANPEFEAIAEKANQLAASPLTRSTIRFAVFRLVSRGFLVEVNRSYQLTPEGKSALSQTKASAGKWLDALSKSGPIR